MHYCVEQCDASLWDWALLIKNMKAVHHIPLRICLQWHMCLIAALRGPFPCFDLPSHKESKY